MSFISASLLAEPPLISLLGEPEQLPAAHHSYSGTKWREVTNVQASIPDSSKDLMDFEEQSSGDRLYAEIYQKNLQKFLGSSFCLQLSKCGPSSENPTPNGIVSIPLIIDDQVCIDSTNRESIYGRGVGNLEIGLNPKKNCENPGKRDRHPKIGRDPGENEQLLILSDIPGESSSGENSGDPSLSSSDEQKRVQFVHTDHVASSLAYSPDMIVGVEDSAYELRGHTPRRLDYLSGVISCGSDTLSDAVLRDSDYLAGESSSSREEGIVHQENLNTFPLRNHTSRAPRRIVKVNLPHKILHRMQEDPRFDGFCHAWVRRPDFCKYGVNCHFIHDFPISLVKKFGMVAVYIDQDGREIKNAEKFLELDGVFVKPKRTKLEKGAKEGFPGCYNSNCRDFIKNDCKFGERCWYKHPTAAVENNKWVTKDVRQLVDEDFRMYQELDEYEKTETESKFGGDRQSIISHEESARSQKHTRVSYSGSNTSHQLSYKTHGVQRLVKNSAKYPLDLAFGSEEDRGIHTVVEQRYNPNPSNPPLIIPTQNHKISNIDLVSESPDLASQNLKILLVDIGHVERKPIVALPRHENTSEDYSYWDDEAPIEDEANYWRNAPPPAKISNFSRRQHAVASEAMTYAGLFKKETCTLQKVARDFVMPPQPLGTRDSKASEIRQAKQAFAQATQEKNRVKDSLLDVSTFSGPKQFAKQSIASYPRHGSIFDNWSTRSGDSEDEILDSDSDWTESLNTTRARKREPSKRSTFDCEQKVNTLIDI